MLAGQVVECSKKTFHRPVEMILDESVGKNREINRHRQKVRAQYGWET